MRILRHVIFSIFVLTPFKSLAAQDNQFICIAEKSTGFSLSGGKWISTDFTTSKIKYLVKKSEKFPDKMSVHEFGVDTPKYECTFDAIKIVCDDYLRYMTISIDNLRFQEIYGVGYVFGDYPGNTPSMTIGTCSRI